MKKVIFDWSGTVKSWQAIQKTQKKRDETDKIIFSLKNEEEHNRGIIEIFKKINNLF